MLYSIMFYGLLSEKTRFTMV